MRSASTKMKLVLIVAVLTVVNVCAANQDFAVNVDNSSGSFNVVVQGDVWLESGPYFFRADGDVYTFADGSLMLIKHSQSSGVDVIGQWEANSFLYQAGSSQVEASIVQYTPDPSIFTYNDPALPFVVFKQKFITGSNNTAASTVSETVSGFPAIALEEIDVPLGYLYYAGNQFGTLSLAANQWGPNTFDVEFGHGSGPLALFDRAKTANTLIITPASEFMSSSIYHQNNGKGINNLFWGVMGGVNTVPRDFETSYIMFCGNQGINKAFVSWGEILQTWYGHKDDFVKSDLTVNYLGYWTDNGAYYSHNTEEGKNYQDTVVDVVSYTQQIGLPVRYFQYDGWWYYKDSNGGIVQWTAMSDVFPSGMEWLYNKTNLPALAHSKFWSSNNTYAKQNGGNYNFIIDGQKALPTEERFWTDLMSSARQWGLLVYEQDFLDTQFDSVTQLHTDVHLAKQWLKEMGNGAAKNGLRIQYCMAYPRHALQSLEIPVVTQARVSGDYHPGNDHWKIGVSSLLAWAIGLAPYKDNFWTTSVQPGNRYNASEPNTALLAVVSTLSTGPVGISDKIGGSNKSLIMKSVNADGLILKPSRPATAIDNTIRRMAWGDFEGPDGEVWSTYSDFGGKNKFGMILAAELTGNYTMTPSMAGFQGFPTSMIFPYNNPSKIQPLTDADPITMSGCSTVDFCLFYVSPVLKVQGKQVLVQGELAKWVPMSPQRVTDISIGDDILISLKGAAAESVAFWFNVDGASSPLTCTLGQDGRASLSFNQQACRVE
ncbi:uncharacterized protein LOC124119101 [Haliotis rufescens]|uniref:uncharacterized protein LOC124119101 n=1 Tax=Haliotis rufescens TaxID=6454 RepID=UPI00201F4102|nr:uncharacterized protein LOC124119101 [Haliotis rufescens]